MQLIVAEKPSVARDLARVLGVRPAGQHAFESDGRVITWCVGHLVELDEPASYDARWKTWRLDTLPMLPAEFRLRASNHAGDQLRAVAKLLRDRRFTSVVNACDAGREGELIFRYVYQFAGGGPPIERLWISSLTDEAIRRGFATLRPGSQFAALGDAARSRSEADWLVGMNATRAVTIRGRLAGADTLYSIGRVQTPTLQILVQREQAIQAFVPRAYWEVRGQFRTAAGERFVAGWRHGAIARLGTAALASAIVTRDGAHGAAIDPAGPCVERVRARTVREPPPLLFDLTSLQRTANRRYGFSAARTLEIAQALYERHKVISYPRTDSRHLSGDLMAELPALFAALASVAEYEPFAAELVAHPPRPSRRVVDDAKVHDHHAIIPTGKPVRLEALDRDEQRIFDLVARRFLGAFFPDAEFAITEAWIRVGPGNAQLPPEPARAPEGEPPVLDTLPPPPDRYLARGRVRIAAGWQQVAGIDSAEDKRGRESDADADSTAVLPQLVEGQRLDARFAARDKQTTPPARFTEATLLGAMESAGKIIDDEALRQAMKDCGLGTAATRASIIETLVKRRYIVREKQHLVPTAIGIGLIAALPVTSLGSPELTGSWEQRLARIARGEESRASFMADIARYVEDTVAAVRRSSPPGAPIPAAPAISQIARPQDMPARSATRERATPRAPSTTRERVKPVARSATRSRATPAAIAKAKAPPIAIESLPCPRCPGKLVAGARGWGCGRWREGCRFVVWFETAGRRLTAAQLRDLIERGKTRKARFVSDRGVELEARLVLDSNGNVRLVPG
ncbi:MAG: topB: topoisomerase [Myxococcales bacterium]|nr:topB: topoisomerase [Myxococcales bacterium]